MSDQERRDCEHGQLARQCRICELEALVAQQAQEIEQLQADRDAFHMDYRIKSDQQSKAALIRAEQAEAEVARQAQEIESLRQLISKPVIADRLQQIADLRADYERQAQEIEQWRCQAAEAEDKYIASVRYADTLIEAKNRHLSEVSRQAQEIQELRSRLASALAEREEALLSIGGVQSDLRKADQEIQDLRSQSVMALAKHYGCGEHVSFSDAWRWLAERVEMETFKSSAETALGAFVARIKALRAEIQDLRTDFESFSEHHAATERELKAALSSRDALREALKKARGYVVERMQLANPYDGPAKPGFVDYDLQMIDRALVETPTEKTL